MSEYDESEFLIQHFPLDKVLAFISDRDEVRRIACAPVERLESDNVAPPVSSMQTLPAAKGYVVSEKGEAA